MKETYFPELNLNLIESRCVPKGRVIITTSPTLGIPTHYLYGIYKDGIGFSNDKNFSTVKIQYEAIDDYINSMRKNIYTDKNWFVDNPYEEPKKKYEELDPLMFRREIIGEWKMDKVREFFDLEERLNKTHEEIENEIIEELNVKSENVTVELENSLCGKRVIIIITDRSIKLSNLDNIRRYFGVCSEQIIITGKSNYQINIEVRI